MNIKNALGFFVLGFLMHTTPALAQSFSVNAVMDESSVRTVWLELMGWVVGGIGFSYLAREGMARVPSLLAAVLPESLLRPTAQPERIPQTVRLAITSF